MSTATLTVSPGTPQTYSSPVAARALPVPMTVAVTPGSGGTVTVEYQVANGGAWRAVDAGNLAGTLAAAASDVLIGPVFALRFTAATAAATVEIAQ